MTIDDLIPPHVTAIVAREGLHKIAGTINGVPELSIKEAVFSIGQRAYLRRKEARAIEDGIRAYGYARGDEKTAAGEVFTGRVLSKALGPAVLGATTAVLPKLISNNPMDRQDIPSTLVMGAGVGGIAGLLNALSKLPPNVAQAVSNAVI